MKFYDKVTITVQSGAGGDGAATGRREAYVAFGGPSGGDGGNGGSVYLVGSHNEYTLGPYRTNKTYKAQSGEKGMGKDMYGKAGEDLILPVPVGTKIYDNETGELLGVVAYSGDRCLVAQGGKGGLGNKHFVDAHKQYSTIALLGEPYHKLELKLELQLLADVALIGTPSVGKSSLINTVSNTKAKVAEYHFTTLTPNLGIIEHRGNTFSMIDIPGLIQGAHEGKGLGYEFLRHIIKSRVLLFTTAIDRFEAGIEETIAIMEELRLYCINYYSETMQKPIACTYTYTDQTLLLVIHDEAGTEITTKALGFLINKIDLVTDDEIQQEFTQHYHILLIHYIEKTYGLSLTKKQLAPMTYLVSAGTRAGIEGMLDFSYAKIQHLDMHTQQPKSSPILSPTNSEVDSIQGPYIEEISEKMLEVLIEEGYIPDNLEKNPRVRQSTHPDVGSLAYILPRGNDEAELWFWHQLAKQGITQTYMQAGVKKGDILVIVSPYRHRKDLYIKRE